MASTGRRPSRALIPDIPFCDEKASLTHEFLLAAHELMALQAEQIQALIADDPDFSRFDLLMHKATEQKERAKYALVQHIRSHHCGDG